MTKFQYKLIMEKQALLTKVIGKFKSIYNEDKKYFAISMKVDGIEGRRRSICSYRLDGTFIFASYLRTGDNPKMNEILNSIEFKCLIDLIKSEHEFKNKKTTMNPNLD